MDANAAIASAYPGASQITMSDQVIHVGLAASKN
jgi:hypothetical protein